LLAPSGFVLKGGGDGESSYLPTWYSSWVVLARLVRTDEVVPPPDSKWKSNWDEMGVGGSVLVRIEGI